MPRWTWGAALLVALAAATAYFWPVEASPPVPAAGQTDGPRDALVIAIAAEPRAFLSPFATGSTEQNISEMIGISLLDTSFECGLVYAPQLAKSWRWSDDGTTLAFELRDDFRWEDGEAVDAEDVAFTVALVNNPAVGSPLRSALAALDPVRGTTVVHATQIEFRMLAGSDQARLLATLATIAVVPAHRFAGVPREAQALQALPLNTTAPLSAGPWRLSPWERGQPLVFTPNPVWPDAAPKLNRVILRVVPEYSARLSELQNGGIDLLDGISVGDSARLTTTSGSTKLFRRGWRTEDAIFWNQVDPKPAPAAPTKKRGKTTGPPAHPLFGETRIRKALTRAIDTDRIVKDLLTSPATGDVYGKRAVGSISPALCEAHADALVPIAHDPVMAKAGLSASGWSDKNGDGVVERAGSDFRFTMIVAAGQPRRDQAALLIQADLKSVGVDMQVETLELAAFAERLKLRTFDAALAGWQAAPYPDLTNWFPGNALNVVGYTPKLALPTGAETTNEAWVLSQKSVYDDQPWTFLYWVDDLVAIDSRFESANADFLFPWRHTERWSVPSERVKYLQ